MNNYLNNYPGGQLITRPPSKWRCRCQTDCPLSSPVFITVRYPLSAMPVWFASFEASRNRYPRTASSPFDTSLRDSMCSLGTIKIWVGACGLMSWNAYARSSSNTLVDGTLPATMSQKRSPRLDAWWTQSPALPGPHRELEHVRPRVVPADVERHLLLVD